MKCALWQTNPTFITTPRKTAQAYALSVSENLTTFLANYLPAQPGDIITDGGEVIGQHNGLMFHTLGQRQGLGIGGRKIRQATNPGTSLTNLSAKINWLSRRVTITHCYSKQQLQAMQLHWCAGQAPSTFFQCRAKVRYRQEDQPCSVKMSENGVSACVEFDEPHACDYSRPVCCIL